MDERGGRAEVERPPHTFFGPPPSLFACAPKRLCVRKDFDSDPLFGGPKRKIRTPKHLTNFVKTGPKT